MLSRVEHIHKSQIYFFKKNKQPDHLFNLVQKTKAKLSEVTEPDDETKHRIKKQIIRRRVDAIIKNGTNKSKVSPALPYLKKKWVSPLTELHENEAFDPHAIKPVEKITIRQHHRDEMQRIVKVLDLNKKLKYFGEYLQVDY